MPGGPDNILGHVLRTCAGELADVLTDIFNISLSQAIIPRCFKTSTIIPVARITCILSERLPPRGTNTNCDVFWVACQTTHHSQPPCITWPISVCLSSQPLYRGCNIHHFALSPHSSGSERQLLQIDFRSAFNTVFPQKLMKKLLLLSLNTATGSRTFWRRDLSLCVSAITLPTPSRWAQDGNQIIKYADDTTVVGLIHRNEESMYREEVKHLEGWCRENNLVLNAVKTKEMIIDFLRSQPEHAPLSISGHTVERVENIEFFGVQISQDLSWNKNTSGIGL